MGAIFLMILLTLGLGTFGFWVYALIEIVSDEYKNDTDKIIWFLLVFFLPFIGTIIYYATGRKKISIPEEEYV